MYFFLYSIRFTLQREADSPAVAAAGAAASALLLRPADQRLGAEGKALLAKIVLYLAPRYAEKKSGKWRLNSGEMFAEALTLLPPSVSRSRNMNKIRHAFLAWKRENPDAWQRMVEEKERDPENYLADIVSSS